MQNKSIGTIIRLIHHRGYGFLRTEDGQDVFFHATGCLTPWGELREGMEVVYTALLAHPRTGKVRAVGIQPVGEIPSSNEQGIGK